MRVVAELSFQRLEFSFSLHGARWRDSQKSLARSPGSVIPAQACGWVCSPVHSAIQLDKISPGAVEQRVKHHLEAHLAGRQREDGGVLGVA